MFPTIRTLIVAVFWTVRQATIFWFETSIVFVNSHCTASSVFAQFAIHELISDNVRNIILFGGYEVRTALLKNPSRLASILLRFLRTWLVMGVRRLRCSVGTR